MRWGARVLIAATALASGCERAAPPVPAADAARRLTDTTFKERVIAGWQSAGVPIAIHEWSEKHAPRIGVEHRKIIATYGGEKSMEAFERFARELYDACREDILAVNPGAEAKRISFCLYASDYGRNSYVLLVQSGESAGPVLPPFEGAMVDRQPEGLEPWRDRTRDE